MVLNGFIPELVMRTWSTIYVSFPTLRQLDLIPSLVAMLLLMKYVVICTIASSAAQVTSFWTLRFAQALMGVRPRHFHHCRSCTAACIAIGSAIQMPTLMSVALVSTMTFVVPRRWLWFPALKRPAACMVDDPSALPMSDAKQQRGASAVPLQEGCKFLAAKLTESARGSTTCIDLPVHQGIGSVLFWSNVCCVKNSCGANSEQLE